MYKALYLQYQIVAKRKAYANLFAVLLFSNQCTIP